MKAFEHEHPLELINLQKVEYINYEEESDDDDLTADDEFQCSCNRCHQEIHMSHKYYYKCTESSCDYSLHKFCAEIPRSLNHPSHSHEVSLVKSGQWEYICCNICGNCGKPEEILYECFYCGFSIDLNCAIQVEKRSIDHPSHPHPLVCSILKPILCMCNGCGKEHKGVFYQCTSCVGFTIHSDCAFLPKNLLIQKTTNNAFYHSHPLTISYSYSYEERQDKHFPLCRVCGDRFDYIRDNWIYKCDKCLYYAHLDCATSRRESFMSILSHPGFGNTVKNYNDADYPNLLNLPFPDETCSLPKIYGIDEVNLQRINHPHQLILVNTQCIDIVGETLLEANSLIMCHDPMKRTQLLCNGCLRPITNTPFFKCAYEDESCNFALHEWCTRLPKEVTNHPCHPQHTLVLMSNVSNFPFNIFMCEVCHLPCNGFAYGCVKCGYYVDVSCGFIPETITHKAHPNHLLSIVKTDILDDLCHMCHTNDKYDFLDDHRKESQVIFRCSICGLYIHARCALLLPEKIRHKIDKHPMHLSYLPIENHKSKYFCEICECEMDPHRCFYHCDECVQSVHSACAPLMLQSETEQRYTYKGGLYKFVNVKFGSIHNVHGHPHPLYFVQGIASDGHCGLCIYILPFSMIFKCLKCKFAVHYVCCKRLNDSSHA